jgi:hypothetical protein
MEGLAKSERTEDLGADVGWGTRGPPTDVGDEGNSHGWLFPDASHRERSELGEIRTLAHGPCHPAKHYLSPFSIASVAEAASLSNGFIE